MRINKPTARRQKITTVSGSERVLLRFFCWALSVLLLTLSAAAQQRVRYHNPVVAGDYPDPSVIRVGADFWATATSSEWRPEFPLLHSRDLVNWDLVGAVFQKRPAWAIGNFWAPEISQHGGRFFVYYTGRKKDGPLCVAVDVSADGKDWTAVGEELDGGFLPPWDRSVRIALFTGGMYWATGKFGWMRIDSKR